MFVPTNTVGDATFVNRTVPPMFAILDLWRSTFTIDQFPPFCARRMQASRNIEIQEISLFEWPFDDIQVRSNFWGLLIESFLSSQIRPRNTRSFIDRRQTIELFYCLSSLTDPPWKD
jgi:hypothetical protein